MMRRFAIGVVVPLALACHVPFRAPATSIARPRTTVSPKYPDILLSAVVEGDVVVDLAIDSTGHVDHALTKTRASSHDLFKMSVLRAIDTTAWRPARNEGVPVPSVRRDTFSFVLKKDSADACPRSSEHHRRICGIANRVMRRSVGILIHFLGSPGLTIA